MTNDFRFGWRLLRKNPGYTAVAVMTLALGIGGTTALFTFVDNVLLKPLPYPDPDRIVRVMQQRPNGDFFSVTTLDLLDWRRESTSFEFLAGYRPARMTLSRRDAEPLLLNAARVSPSYFDVARTRPLLGRTFTVEEEQPGRDNVIVLSPGLWLREFGGDPSAIGRTVLIDAEPHTIVGVMPEDTTFDRGVAEFWKPLAFTRYEQTRGLHWLVVYARLKPGVTVQQANEELDALAATYAELYPDTNNGFGALVEPYADVIVQANVRTQIYVLFAAAGMVLLIACANLANLSLARGLSRGREVAVRAAVGARRWELVRQFLAENLLVALLGGLLSIPLGYIAVRWLARSVRLMLPAEADLQFDTRVLLFTATASILTGLLFGLIPAFRATRLDLAGAMKDGSRGLMAGSARSRLRGGLVVAQVALAFVLLTGAALLVETLTSLRNLQTTPRSNNILAMTLPTSAATYTDDLPRFRVYLGEIERAVAAVPGVRETTLSAGVPLRPGGYTIPMQRVDAELVVRPRRPLFQFRAVEPSYFRVMGLPLRRGRLLEPSDREGGRPVAVINEALAGRLWPGEDPLGQRILVPEVLPGKIDLGDDIPWEIVGVVADERMTALNVANGGHVYVTVAQSPMFNPNLVVRADGDPRQLVQTIRAAVDTVNEQQALSDIRTLDELKDESLVGNRLQATVVSAFSALSLLLAALGIYGVVSNLVTQRREEMALRAAMGATVPRLLWLTVRSGMILTVVGLALGVMGALLALRGLQSLLFGVTPSDPATMAGVAGLLLLIALLACLAPARRGARVNLVTFLR